MAQTYEIQGMHCGSCVAKVQDALKKVTDTAEVSLKPPRAVVSGGQAGDLSALNAAVSAAGSYTLKPVSVDAVEEKKSWIRTYQPLLLIVGLIALASFRGVETAHDWMLHFMAGFFIVFGFFKLLDIQGFRDAYATYDLLAKRWLNYGYVYPFLELALGFAFLFRFELTLALWASVILMGFGSLGVIQALREKRKIRCACLGTVLNLPMSTITLVEDLGMVAMSALMLWQMA